LHGNATTARFTAIGAFGLGLRSLAAFEQMRRNTRIGSSLGCLGAGSRRRWSGLGFGLLASLLRPLQ
jgi:hypothetical protein